MPESETNTTSPGGVRLEVDAGVAVITIDRPDVRNAIGSATTDELEAALDEILGTDAAVLVVRGAGDRAFVSGGDLKELSAIRTHDDAVGMASRVRGVLDRVASFPIPVVAALNGHAMGGGAEVAIAADIRIAADDIKIGFNQVSLGIMPAWGRGRAAGPGCRPGPCPPGRRHRGALRRARRAAAGSRRHRRSPQHLRARLARARQPARRYGTGHDARREVSDQRGSSVVPPRPGGRRGRRVRGALDRRCALGRGGHTRAEAKNRMMHHRERRCPDPAPVYPRTNESGF